MRGSKYAQLVMAVSLMASGGCWVFWDDYNDWDDCSVSYSYDQFGFCQACDCWGCYTTDDLYCSNNGSDACFDSMCLEGCYYDSTVGGCVETTVCFSDGECLAGEVCDLDRSTCMPVDRAECVPVGLCGDGVLDSSEQCDDGNNVNGDGCSSFCAVEGVEDCVDWLDNDADGLIDCTDADCAGNPSCASFCGDGVLSNGEQCDDGNNQNGDGCSSICTVEQPSNEICGDGADNDQDGAADCADSDCAADAGCQPECVIDADCSDGQQCNNGVCCDDPENGCIPNGRDPVCQFDYQCGHGACVDGFCHDECVADADCPTGQTCQNGLCLTDPDGGDECIFDADCAAAADGEYCINAYCHESCAADTDCADNEVCRGGICQPDDGAKAECAINADCPVAGQECVNAVCRFSCDNDTDCENSCGTGSACDLGYCLFAEEVSPQCATDADCTAGNVCANATCVAVP
jgi:cysteine-rich repeat protein/Cys-rich repeat protein